ncbi:MAG: O-antigen ligase family protein, partial [Firmicutes bacterium]|nr:O-antigen ligase family protein [Bacillota bacterium]
FLFAVFAWISSLVSFGLSTGYFFSVYFTNCVYLFGLYACIRTSSDPDRLMLWYARAAALSQSVVCLGIMIRATLSLCTEEQGHNLYRGCFQSGRLCGLGNANVLGFCALSLLIVSVFGALRTKGIERSAFGASAVIGWFTLGLTNCRTGAVCLSASLGILTFFRLRGRALGRTGRFTAKDFVIALLVFCLIVVVSVSAFYLPTRIYKGVLVMYAKAAGQQYLLKNTETPISRSITAGTGTLADRFLIQKKVISDIFSSPRRLWLGVSEQNGDRVKGVYDGHHEISSAHAHNTYLELLMREGFLGMAAWLPLLLLWCSRGLKNLSDSEAPAAVRYLMAAAAAILCMGVIEAAPFSYRVMSYVSTPFFVICAYSMSRERIKG